MTTTNPTEPTRMLGYLRVSTTEQSDSGLGLEAQRAALELEAERRGWQLTLVTEIGSAGSMTNRPELARALEALDRGEAEGLVVAKLDRLARSTADFCAVAARAERKGWALVALDAGVDSTTTSGALFLEILAVLSAHERRLIRTRTREALAQKRARGERVGRPQVLPESVRQRVAELRAAGLSQSAIARTLNDERVPTARGGLRWYQSTVCAVLSSCEYAAELEAARRERVG